MSKRIYIYGLYHPETNELRYIGKTVDLNNRLWSHIRDAKGGQRTHKAAWIRKLLRKDLEPVISVIWETTEEGWQVDEKACIVQAKQEGIRLTNLTSGGDGIEGYNHSDETKEKIRRYNLESGKVPPNWTGQKQSPQHIQKRIEARRRNDTYTHTQETKDLISQKNTGKNMGNTHSLGYRHTNEWKEAQSKRLSGKNNPNYGKKLPDKVKKKISDAKRGSKDTDEVKENKRQAFLRRERAKREDHLARISVSYSDIMLLSDDPRINEIRKLYLLDGMIQKEIITHLGLSPKSNRPRKRVKNAIETIPTVDNPNPEQPMLPGQSREIAKREQWFKDGYHWCSKCKQKLPVSDFNSSKNGKFGLHGWCRSCFSEGRMAKARKDVNSKLSDQKGIAGFSQHSLFGNESADE